MQIIIPQHIQEAVVKNLNRFPALGSELTEDQVNNSTPGDRILGLTSHQKRACRLVAARLNWHPMYVGETCTQSRPALVCSYGHEKHWEMDCGKWQVEHEMPVDDLATKYEEEFTRICDRIFEPISLHSSGVRMSAHDDTKEKYPGHPDQW